MSSPLEYIVDDSNIKRVLSQWVDITIKEKIHDSYKDINKDLNLNSLVLFSGAKDKEFYQIMVRPTTTSSVIILNGIIIKRMDVCILAIITLAVNLDGKN